jgi:hypothetical protein
MSSCTISESNITGIQLEKYFPEKATETKVIYNYKDKTEQQIKDAAQLNFELKKL